MRPKAKPNAIPGPPLEFITGSHVCTNFLGKGGGGGILRKGGVFGSCQW